MSGAAKPSTAETTEAADAKNYRRILALVLSHTGVDFSQFRDPTIQRQIQRRMVVRTRPTLPEYIELLEKDQDEIDALFSEVLISEGHNRGATFTIELPLTPKENEDSPPTENAPAPVSPASSAEAIGVSILLVEDHEPTRSALEYLLTWRHYRVFTAGTLAEARTIAGREKIDLVISDIGLPDGSGNDLMTELRERHGLKGIAVTGYGMEHEIVSRQSAGFVTHLIKPIQMQALEAALAATMQP